MWSVVIKMCILPFARLTKPRNFFSISEDWQAGPRPREGGHRFCFPSRVTPKNHTAQPSQASAAVRAERRERQRRSTLTSLSSHRPRR